MSQFHKIKDKDISQIIGYILRYGVYLSLSIALVGGIVYLYRHGNEINLFQHKAFVEKDENIAELLRNTFKGIVQGHGFYIIELGILLLIATPLSRVIFSLFAFKLEGDNLYVLITFIVLLIIIISIITGFGG
ncbi:DUF1634 domain-containing protein [Arachidicoccus soli]|uniref:DUF1634 domain-containing protein n=1 Tax=Arachidicoccus soli TaxID=2341117 RepID=A0A386HRE8_9BACT|nr:DUF1634 domain-containing protein [Arachidicoccus soli]AYD48527.1 DUF1634 domain-containing protein [Arachidicoccus soli]